MKPYLLSIILAALSLAECKKNSVASLPAASQEGKNTAGCLIDNQLFVAKSYGGGVLDTAIPALQGGFAFDHSYHLAMHGQFGGQTVEIMLFLQGRQLGTYLLDKDTQYYPRGSPRYVLAHATYRVASTQEVFVTNAKHTGQVVLTAANVQQGLSAGTFAFKAVSTSDSTKIITITDGRFDRGDW